MTLSDVIRNALDRDYSVDRTAAHLGALLLERALIRRRGDAENPRLRELDRLIPMQETLALRKLNSDELFDRLAQLGIRVETK